MDVYDICVNYDVLCDVENKLKKIEYDVENTTKKMNESIQRAQGFLEGNQFENAKNATKKSIELTGRTLNNIRNSEKYIKELREVIEEYGMCTYSGE